MADKKITTIIDFKTTGVEDLIKNLTKISEALPESELKTSLGNIEKDFSAFVKLIEGKTGDIRSQGIDKFIEKLQGLSNTVRASLSAEGFSFDSSLFDDEMREVEEKIKDGTKRLESLNAQLDKIKQDMAQKLQTNYGEPKDESYLDTTKATSHMNKLKKDAAKAEKDGNKDLKAALDEEIKLWQQYLEDLKKYFTDRKTLGAQAGGTSRGVNLNIAKLEELKASKTITEKIDPELVKNQKKEVQNLVGALNSLIEAMSKMHEAKAEEVHKKAAAEAKKHKKEVDDAAKSEKELEKAIKDGEKSMGKKIVTGLTYYTVFNKIKQILRTSVRAIEELDRAMTKAAIVTNMTKEETWSLLRSYQNLAGEVGKTTAEIANLNAFFLQQGKTAKQAMEMTEAAAKSAAVAGTSLQDAANYITSAIHGFGLAASEAERVADKFAALGASSASSFEEIAIAMSKVAPVAQSAGVGIDFMMGILAKGIHTTREAPEAIGTAMKTIFARMRELTDIGKATEDGMSLNRVEKAVNSIGVSLRDVTGQFRNLEDVLIDVGMKWKDLNSLEQAYLATALAGTRQQPRLLAILNDFDTTLEFIETSQEADRELMYQHMEFLESMEAASNKLKNSWEKIVTTIIESKTVISIFNLISAALEKVGAGIKFIADRPTLMITLLGIVGSLMLKNIVLLGKSIALRVKDFLLAGKTALVEQKGIFSTMAVRIKDLVVRRATSTAIIEETASTNALVAAKAGEGVIIKKNTTASIYEIFIMKLKTIAWSKYVAVISVALIKLALIVGAVLLVVAAAKAFAKAWKEAHKTLKDFNKEIDENNKKIHESGKKVKDLRKLQDEYVELSKKIHRTSEEIERMNQLLEELKNFQDGDEVLNFTRKEAGELVIDEKAIEDFYKKQYDLQIKAMTENLEKAEESIAKFGEKALKEKQVQETFLELGERAYQSFLFGIEDESRRKKIEKSLAKAIRGLNLNDFYKEEVKDIVIRDQYGQEYTTQSLVRSFDIESYEEKIQELSSALINHFEEVDTVLESTLLIQLDTFAKQIEDISETNLKKVFSEAYPELSKLYDISKGLNLELTEMASIVEALSGRGFGLDKFLEFSERSGFGTEVSNSYGYYGGIWNAISRLNQLPNLIAEAQLGLDRAEIKKDEEGIERYTTELERLRAQYQSLMNIPIQDLQTAITSKFFNEYSNQMDDLFAGNFSGRTYSRMSNELANRLEAIYSPEEAARIARNFMDYFVLTEEEIASRLGSIGHIVSKSFDVKDEIRKGNYDSYFELIDELGEGGTKLMEEFLVSRDTLPLQDALFKKRRKELDISISILEEAEHLTDSEKKRLEKLKLIRTTMSSIVYAQEAWKKGMEETDSILERMKSNLDFVDRLNELEISGPMKDHFESLYTEIRARAISQSDQSVDLASQILQDSIDDLFNQGLMNEEGEIIPEAISLSQQLALDNYYEAQENLREVGEQRLKLIEDEIERYKKIKEKEIKIIEDIHKEQMDLLKKQHDEKWKSIDYERRILDLQDKVILARNRMAAALYGGDKAGQLDAQKALREAREARQKEIEQQILDNIQKEEELKRDERIEAIQNDIKENTREIVDELGRIYTTLDLRLMKPRFSSGAGSGLSQNNQAPSSVFSLENLD